MPAAKKTAPKMLTREMVLVLRWKIWGMRSRPEFPAGGDRWSPGRYRALSEGQENTNCAGFCKRKTGHARVLTNRSAVRRFSQSSMPALTQRNIRAVIIAFLKTPH